MKTEFSIADGILVDFVPHAAIGCNGATALGG